MPSRAFFRCRACGEPVVAGAYRCPNCGIDFPSGTPGAPRAPHSPADVPDPRPRMASELEKALGDIMDPTSAPKAREDEETERQSGARSARRDGQTLDVSFEDAADDGEDWTDAHEGRNGGADDADEDDAGRRQTRTAEIVPHGERDDAPAAFPTVRPERVRPERTEPAASRAPTPSADHADAAKSRALVSKAPRKRRSKAGALSGTLVLAVLFVVAAGAGYVFLKGEDSADDPPEFARALGVPTEVSASDGWVTIPRTAQSLALTGTGPFRIRLDGIVYTVDAGRTVRLDRAGASSVAVRAVREGTSVAIALTGDANP